MSLYPKSKKPFILSNFVMPTAEYRGYPFWSWNTKLEKSKLLRQLPYFKQMGMGGATIHCRTGLDTPYMGPEYMAIVQASVDWAKENKMFIWLYDEDRWPSGYGGGLVTKEEKFRARHLLWTSKPYGQEPHSDQQIHASTAGTGRTGNGQLLFIYDVEVDRQGYLKGYRRLSVDSMPKRSRLRGIKGQLWYAYREVAPEQPWFNYQTYVDTLNPQAIKRFIQTTHEVYRDFLKKDFGKTVPAIFTDEPQFTHKQYFKKVMDRDDIVIPYTDDFGESYLAAYGERFEDRLPELFWELPGRQPSVARYQYHDHIAERFSSAFADTIGKWCRQNGIAMTGHMMEEPTLASQTGALGEAMRSFRSFDIPGIDILCDHHPEVDGHPIEFTTAKQAQSAVRQYGREGLMSEIYGVTNWDFTFAGHKAQGDWQAALGVTARVHHLSLVTLEGEAKRDYPASIFYQSPWYKEYGMVESHFARINSLMTRGKPAVRVGVIHPVESYWLCFGPMEHTGPERTERDGQFAHLTKWLVHNLVDYDYISESLLPSQCSRVKGKKFNIGKMAYDCMIVPGMRTIRSTTLDRLEQFAQNGGKIVFVGEIPSLVDARESVRARKLAGRSECSEFNKLALSQAVEEFREFGVYDLQGILCGKFAAQIRDEGAYRYIFVCNTHRAWSTDSSRAALDTTIRIKGQWDCEEFDTMTGKTIRRSSSIQDDWTVIQHAFSPMGSLLLRLKKTKIKSRPVKSLLGHSYQESGRLSDPVRISLSEPNVLLLDQPSWRINKGQWQPADEILRIDNKVRAGFGLGPKDFAIPQPWSDREPRPILGEVSLRYIIDSRISVKSIQLALEKRSSARIEFNGSPVENRKDGWWVDEKIECVRLPRLKEGLNELIITYPYTRKVDLENVYLLGNFGVRLAGRHPRIVEPVRELGFGDWTTQGLPFYAGNVTYHCQIPKFKGGVFLEIPHFKGPLISVSSDNKDIGKIAFPPYRISLGGLPEKIRTIDITLYGNRYNSFGNLHNMSLHHWNSLGAPCGYRTLGDDWSYEYQLRPMGILVAPLLTKIKS